MSCSKESPTPTIDPNIVTLYVGDKVALKYSGEKCTWSSYEPLIAEVDQNGCVTAMRVGETNIRANDALCTVSVIPKLNTYKEPCIKWGASKSEVRAFMSGFQEQEDSGDNLVFKAYGDISGYLYVFKDGTSLQYSSIIAPLYSWDKILDFLMERYVPVGIIDFNNYTVAFISINKRLAIATKPIEGTWGVGVVYMPYDSSKSIDSIFNEEF